MQLGRMLAVRMHVVRQYVSMQFGKIHAESRHVDWHVACLK